MTAGAPKAAAAIDLADRPPAKAFAAAAASFFDLAISVLASPNDAKGFVEFGLAGRHAMNHEVFLGLVKHDQFDQCSRRREPEDPRPRWIVIDHVVRNVSVLESVLYVGVGVSMVEGRVMDPDRPHLINVTRNYLFPKPGPLHYSVRAGHGLAVISDGLSISQVAQKVGVPRQTLHAWLARYEA